MNQIQMQKELALLQSQNDHLQTELSQLDELMKTLGFVDGIATVKATAQEIISFEDSF